MQLKASTDYGLRAVLYLASKKGTCSSKDIAQDMSIPRDYLIPVSYTHLSTLLVKETTNDRGTAVSGHHHGIEVRP